VARVFALDVLFPISREGYRRSCASVMLRELFRMALRSVSLPESVKQAWRRSRYLGETSLYLGKQAWRILQSCLIRLTISEAGPGGTSAWAMGSDLGATERADRVER